MNVCIVKKYVFPFWKFMIKWRWNDKKLEKSNERVRNSKTVFKILKISSQESEKMTKGGITMKEVRIVTKSDAFVCIKKSGDCRGTLRK